MTGIPKSERIWVKILDNKGTAFYITSNPIRNMYFIYRDDNGKAVKLGKGINPILLEQKYMEKN